MSRSYRIRIPIEVLLSNDKLEKLGRFSMPFDIMHIMPAERMHELLKNALLAAGCQDTGDGMVVPCENGRSAVVDIKNRKIRLEVPLPEDYGISVYEEHIEQLRADVEDALNKGKLLNGGMGLYEQNELARHQAIELRNLALAARKVVNAALKEAYREAIKEKAAQIGNVSAVSESSDGGVTRIRIEVEA
jgi:hypothetical protein